jgi:hypothetical protein
MKRPVVVTLLLTWCVAAAPAEPAPRHAAHIKSVRRIDETIRRLGGEGDNFHMSWAADDKVYFGLCDGRGFPGMPQANYNTRMYSVAGDAPDLRFEFMPTYPDLLNSGPGAIFRYYGFGTLALGGRIYQFLSTLNVPFNEPNPRFVGAKLIYSPDGGGTWCNQDGTSPVRWETWGQRSKQNMAFFEEDGDAFSLITVLQMGKDYRYNTDGLVYLYSPNGNTEGRMNQLVLARVPKDRIVERKAYEFFAGGGPEGARWSPRVEGRAPVHTFPAGWVNKTLNPYAWQPSVVYYPATGQYLMANWGMGQDAEGKWFGKPSYLGFWTAPQPWGPWTQVYEERSWTPGGDEAARCYQPQIGPKWIAADGKSFWLVWTDYQVVNGKRPYYGFNAQRVDVELGE